MKLTARQKDLLGRELCDSFAEPTILLIDSNDDRIAKNLEAKGLGCMANFKWQYSWRPRSGYINNFMLSDLGVAERTKLKEKRANGRRNL